MNHVIELRNVGQCPHGRPAYRGMGSEYGFYYILQLNEINKATLYRCSKDWEPSYEVTNNYVIKTRSS